jgi:hypothetical protein
MADVRLPWTRNFSIRWAKPRGIDRCGVPFMLVDVLVPHPPHRVAIYIGRIAVGTNAEGNREPPPREGRQGGAAPDQASGQGIIRKTFAPPRPCATGGLYLGRHQRRHSATSRRTTTALTRVCSWAIHLLGTDAQGEAQI